MAVKQELVTGRTSDGVELDGIWYESEPSRLGALFIPGRAQNFYTGVVRWLAPFLAERGIPSLALNTRDHDHAEVDGIPAGGLDLEAGLEILASRGCTRYLLAGISYGSNKAALYLPHAAIQPAAVLLGPVGGIKSYLPDLWGQVLASVGNLAAPLLVLQAGADEYIPEPEVAGHELISAAARCHSSRLDIVAGANHGFVAHKEEVRRIVGDWLGASLAMH
jgi:dienelactone hydrolase